MDQSTYIDSLESITANDLYDGLMLQGMFTEKLPKIFTMDDFCNCVKDGLIIKDSEFSKLVFNYIPYETMRDTNVPRLLAVPNPFAYHILCKFLSEHWEKIKNHFIDKTAKHLHKVSQIHIRKIKDSKCLFKLNYQEGNTKSELNIDLMLGKCYLVKTDISSCFPSMYSHALSWALVGKNYAKVNKGNSKEWYNKIDIYSRKISNNETHGVLIGPHTSNILSEIILTSVDAQLADKYSYIRFIDDYSCYVNSYEEAQLFLIDLSKNLREYGLTLNHKKTKIVKLPIPLNEDWIIQLNSINLNSNDDKISFSLIQNYLDKAISLSQANEGKSTPLNYAIKTLSKYQYKLSERTQEYYIKRILNLALLRPYLVTILDEFIFTPFSVNVVLLSDFIKRLYASGIEQANYEACIYALYFATKYNQNLDNQNIVSDSIGSDSCFFKLFAYLYLNHFQNKTQLKQLKNHARELLNDAKQNNKSNLIDENWIFIFEVLPISVLTSPWKKLALNGKKISFIKPRNDWLTSSQLITEKILNF